MRPQQIVHIIREKRKKFATSLVALVKPQHCSTQPAPTSTVLLPKQSLFTFLAKRTAYHLLDQSQTVIERQNQSLLSALVKIRITYLMTRATHNGREHGARSVITGKSSFAHTTSVINDQSRNFVLHFRLGTVLRDSINTTVTQIHERYQARPCDVAIQAKNRGSA